MATIIGTEKNGALFVNNDALEIENGRRAAAGYGYCQHEEGMMPFAYVLLGAIAFPLVLVAALAGGMGLIASGLVALTLSGPVAFVIYLGLSLTISRSA